ncbi:MAG TPA: hypothetical protein VGK73_16755 [Polyangiaceae bacterium]
MPREATLQALRTERGEARLVPVCSPPGFTGSGLSWNHLAEVFRAENSDGVPMVYVHAQAYANVGGRNLVAEYSDEDPDASTLDDFYQVLSTIHAEHVPQPTAREQPRSERSVD